MEYPKDKDDLACELENFHQTGWLTDDKRKFFDEFVQDNPKNWMTLLDDEEVELFYSNLYAVLQMSVFLYQIDHFKGLVIRALAGLHHRHQLLPFSDRQDVSVCMEEVKAFLETAAGKLSGGVDVFEAVPQEKAIWLLYTTKNRYLLCTLLLNILRETFSFAYPKYVEGKMSLYTYQFAFWEAFDELSGNTSLYEWLWLDLMSQLVGTKPSAREFQEIISKIESQRE